MGMNPDWISPPGDTILDIMAESGTTAEGLADMMGMSYEEVNSLLKGVMPITRDIANKLMNSIGAPASFWMNREQQYRNELHKLATSKPELVIRDAEINKIKLEKGQVLIVKVSGGEDLISMADMDSLKKGFQSIFPNNKVVLLAVPNGSSIDLTVGEGSEYPDNVAENCNTSPVSYCGDCSCGKKERVEKQQKGE